MIEAKREADQWHKLYQIFDDPDVSKLIKLLKLQWTGDVQRVWRRSDTRQGIQRED